MSEEIQQQLPDRGLWHTDFHQYLFGGHRFDEVPICTRCGKLCNPPYSFARREWCKPCLDTILPDIRDYWKVWDTIVNSTANPAAAVDRGASQVAAGSDPVQSAASAPQANVCSPGGMAVET